jgi:hypothetical protein
LQIRSLAAMAAGTIFLKPAGNLAAPFGLDGKVSFRLSGNPARERRSSEAAQGGVAETTHIRRIAVHGATVLTGFYHRSVLRCGRLAERKSGVEDILSAGRHCKNICAGLSRIEYPRQPGRRKRQSIHFAVMRQKCTRM